MIPTFIANAFITERPFSGNPAAVCLLPQWPSDAWLGQVAEQHNLSETAFVVSAAERAEIRWFTPTTEVNLCGHATLAAAHVLFTESENFAPQVRFKSKSGELSVRSVAAGELEMDFPVQDLRPSAEEGLEEIFGSSIVHQCKGGEDLLVQLESAQAVADAAPAMDKLARYPCRGVVITARGNESDFVSRFFGPNAGVPEDPVTGSAHCALAPYWAQRLQKSTMRAVQLSARGGALSVTLEGQRVLLTGRCVTYLRGSINEPGDAQ